MKKIRTQHIGTARKKMLNWHLDQEICRCDLHETGRSMVSDSIIGNIYIVSMFCCRMEITLEPPHGKINNLHRRKQKRRSASQ